MTQGGGSPTRGDATISQRGKDDVTTSQQGKREANERQRRQRTKGGGLTREPAASTDDAMQAGGNNVYSTQGERAAEQK